MAPGVRHADRRIPESLHDGPRLHWSWAAPVVIEVAGAPAATGTRLEIHADAGPRARWFAMLGLQAVGLSQIDITGETVTAATAPLNDDCRDPFLVGDGDGMVGIADFLFLLSDWGPCPSVID